MYGAILGDLAGFPFERSGKILPRGGSLFPEDLLHGQAALCAGEHFSDKTVLTAAVQAGLMEFRKKLPQIAGGKSKQFEEVFREELASAIRRTCREYPLAGYPMELSIWLFREGSAPVMSRDPGPAARVSPVVWMFQDDLYMARHMAVLHAGVTHRDRETIRAADAAACTVFLAVHHCTKEYIAEYMKRVFGYRQAEENDLRQEILTAEFPESSSNGRTGETGGTGGLILPGTAGDTGNHPGGGNDGTADGSGSLPALSVRAALHAFLYGRDFEDVLQRAIRLGTTGPMRAYCSDVTAIAGSIAEAFFGVPQALAEMIRRQLPQDLAAAACDFSTIMEGKKEQRERDPAAKARWENALTRASGYHPAAVRGNESLEKAFAQFNENKEPAAFAHVLETLRLRRNQGGRLFVPLVSAARKENGQEDGPARGPEPEKEGQPGKKAPGVVVRMQAIRTRDGKLWQPAYTSRECLDTGRAAMASAAEKTSGAPSPENMVLSYAIDALLKRFLPAAESDKAPDPDKAAADPGHLGRAEADEKRASSVEGPVPAAIEGIVFNPYGKHPFFLPGKTIADIYALDRISKDLPS